MKRLCGALWAAGAFAVCAWPSGVALAAAERGGDAVIVSADTHTAIDHGGSSTVWSFQLPSNAQCPGDSLHDQWRVQSFLVPASTDPASLKYLLQGPDLDTGHPLFDVDTHPLSQLLLQPNTSAGQPAYLDTIPDVSLAVYAPGRITPGTYRVGLACTLWRETARYWDTTIVVTKAPADKPSGFVWRLASAPATVINVAPSAQWPRWVAAIAVLIGFAVVVLRFRRTR